MELALLEDIYTTLRYIPRGFRVEEVLRVREAVDKVFKVVRRTLIKLARHRAEVYRDIRHYLKIIMETAKELDREAEVYLFNC
ncbi:MAG: hypothetical protein QW611_07530 [Ignisphaera sp.]